MEEDANIAEGHTICYSPEAKGKDSGGKICIQILVLGCGIGGEVVSRGALKVSSLIV